jgi:AhpD family alkylhydroperoxidase
METNYPQRRNELQILLGKLAKELPGPLAGFGRLHKETTASATLPAKVKELIALGIAIAARCQGCIAFHVHDAIAAGASRQEVLDAIGVAIMMGGGPAAMYACEAYEALGQFEASAAAAE